MTAAFMQIQQKKIYYGIMNLLNSLTLKGDAFTA